MTEPQQPQEIEAPLADWQISYRDLLVDGTTYRVIPPVQGLGDLPDLVTSDQDRLRADGAIPGDDFLSARVVTFDLLVVAGDGFQAAMDAVFSAFQPTRSADALEPMRLRIPGIADGGDRRLVGRVRRRSAPVDLTWDDTLPTRSARITVEFHAPDPRIYDDAESVVTVGLESSGTGHRWPQAWPMDWGGPSQSGIVTVVNSGTIDAPWTAVITGPVTNPVIENVDSGQSLSFSANGGLSLAAGETLVVDSATRTALLGGTASRYSRLASPQWWDLPPGQTRIRFGGSTTGSPSMTITWRSAWI